MTRVTLPEVPYLPGITARPGKAVFASAAASVRPGMTAADLAGSAAWAAGHEAFARGYYWEAHELWEPVWAALPREGPDWHLARALIQCANARLKARMGRSRAAARIAALAEEAFAQVSFGEAAIMGMTREEAEEVLREARAAVLQDSANMRDE